VRKAPAERKTPAEGRKFLDVIPPKTIEQWFKDALSPRCRTVPSFDACIEISDRLRKLVNKAENPGLPIEEQRDSDPDIILAERFDAVLDARNRLLFVLEEYFEYSPRHEVGEAFGFVQLADLLIEQGTAGTPRPAARAPVGRPRAKWHAFGRDFAGLVAEALSKAGYQGSIDETDPDSPVAHIGAFMVNAVVAPWRTNKQEIGADTFATAMKGGRKSRSRARNPKA
jgi:hypothetical protein